MQKLEDYEYEERVVCFIDVLGFSERIRKTEIEPNCSKLLTDTCNAINVMNLFTENLLNKNLSKDMRVTQFSDSLVISFPLKNPEYSIIQVFSTIKFIQIFLLLLYKMLLRGGIVVGKIVHTDKLLVGPAMIAAYRLESKSAVNPRIIIDPAIIPMFNDIKDELQERSGSYESIVRKDMDEMYYIDYFNFDDGDRYFKDDTECLMYFKSMLEMIIDNLKNPDVSIRAKYSWMYNKLKESNKFDVLLDDMSHSILSKFSAIPSSSNI